MNVLARFISYGLVFSVVAGYAQQQVVPPGTTVGTPTAIPVAPPPGASETPAATVPGAAPVPGASGTMNFGIPVSGKQEPAPPLPQIGPNYVIGPGDTLQIVVWREADLSGGLEVRPDGMISLPLLGDVKASGLTPMALAADVATRLKAYLVINPTVTITVTGANSNRVYLIGQVGRPGMLPLGPGMTPLQAIASSGGLSAFANAKHIYILRQVNGKQQKFFYDYKKALKTGDQQGVTLYSGDTIVIP